PIARRRHTPPAIVQDILPALETWRIGLATEKVQVMLTNEEILARQRIWPVRVPVVIVDGHCSRSLGAQSSSRNSAQRDSKSFCGFRVGIVNDTYEYRLGCFAGRKPQSADNKIKVAPL